MHAVQPCPAACAQLQHCTENSLWDFPVLSRRPIPAQTHPPLNASSLAARRTVGQYTVALTCASLLFSAETACRPGEVRDTSAISASTLAHDRRGTTSDLHPPAVKGATYMEAPILKHLFKHIWNINILVQANLPYNHGGHQLLCRASQLRTEHCCRPKGHTVQRAKAGGQALLFQQQRQQRSHATCRAETRGGWQQGWWRLRWVGGWVAGVRGGCRGQHGNGMCCQLILHIRPLPPCVPSPLLCRCRHPVQGPAQWSVMRQLHAATAPPPNPD